MGYSPYRFWYLTRSFVSGGTFCLLFFPSLLMAAAPARSATEAVSASQIVSLLAGLVLVLMVFFIIVYLLKRVSGLHGMNKGHMKIVDTMHLGTKERLLIVKVTNEYLLLGISAQGIHPLHVLSDDLIETDGQEQEEPVFNQLLSKMKLKGA